MKIEIAEQMLASWLKHVRECQMVTLNWKASPHWPIAEERWQRIEKLVPEIESYLNEKFGNNESLFKQNASLQQVFRQSEVDVVGACLQQDGNSRYIAVETAFHSNGLGYGDNTARVTKKLLRAALSIYLYFNSESAELIFATPFARVSVANDIQEALLHLSELCEADGFHFSFKFIANENFANEIELPLMEKVIEVEDTSDLYARFVQLNQLCEQRRSALNIPAPAPRVRRQVHHAPAEDVHNVETIGMLVQRTLPGALQQCSADEIQQLFDADYCRQVFNLRFPLLATNRYVNGYSRYYATALNINGAHCYLCSQWYTKQQGRVKQWLREHGIEP